ncbi:hypothetical protein ABBQ32_013773 [Trebouxia sp. C0010 RCD-2024]
MLTSLCLKNAFGSLWIAPVKRIDVSIILYLLHVPACMPRTTFATAAAEQLLAEEADAAAKAAAKRTKKQKAKAQKQQALSEAASASEPSADISLHTQQDQAPMATLHQSSPSASRDCGLSPDSDTAGVASQLQDSAAAVDASKVDDARFLHQLFCCPITQVAMVDPVIAADGHTNERSAIQHWLQGRSLSPVTGDKLPHTRLVRNVLVKIALAQYSQAALRYRY